MVEPPGAARVYVIYDGEPGGAITRLAESVAQGAASIAGIGVVLHAAHQASV